MSKNNEEPLSRKIKNSLKKIHWIFYLNYVMRTLTLRLLAVLISDEIFIKHQYRKHMGKSLNLREPQTFNEKIQWLKLYYRNKICTVCADKYAVRDYVKSRVGGDILTQIYKTYTCTKDIDLGELPEAFVLKVNHGNAQNIICVDKSKINWKRELRLMSAYMKRNLYYDGREWAYKDIKPLIICEEYLNEDGQPPKDYKFYCFNGRVGFIQIDIDRFSNHKEVFYDKDWKKFDFYWNHSKPFMHEINKPEKYEKMVEISEKLAQEFPFVRIDLYCVNERIYFGEMTFYPANGKGGMEPEKFDLLFGNMLDLPDKKIQA